jgi:hypothetical protein
MNIEKLLANWVLVLGQICLPLLMPFGKVMGMNDCLAQSDRKRVAAGMVLLDQQHRKVDTSGKVSIF